MNKQHIINIYMPYIIIKLHNILFVFCFVPNFFLFINRNWNANTENIYLKFIYILL
jgi:hypothetical protein